LLTIFALKPLVKQGVILRASLFGQHSLESYGEKESAALAGEEEEEVPYRYCRQL
jgi:hypothetical protein